MFFAKHLSKIPHFEIPFGFPPLVFFGNVLTLIVKLLSFGQSNLHFYKTSFEVYFHWNNRVSFLRDLTDHLLNLFLVHQKLAPPERIFVENISLFIWADMHTIEDHLPIFNMDKGFLDAALAHAHGLYFGSSKSDTGFKSLFEKIIVIDFFIVGYLLLRLFRHPGSLLFVL